jgi:hypothetical protein
LPRRGQNAGSIGIDLIPGWGWFLLGFKELLSFVKERVSVFPPAACEFDLGKAVEKHWPHLFGGRSKRVCQQTLSTRQFSFEQEVLP